MKRLLPAIALASLGVAACSSVPPPHEREASTTAAIRSAHEVGADQVPQAALHLKLAQEQLDKGKALMNDGDNRRAEYIFLRAQADAELSLAFARENKSRTEAQVLLDRVRAARSGAPQTLPSPSTNPPTSQNQVE